MTFPRRCRFAGYSQPFVKCSQIGLARDINPDDQIYHDGEKKFVSRNFEEVPNTPDATARMAVPQGVLVGR